jgi:cytochrome c oxidase cbb3-type subunit IV
MTVFFIGVVIWAFRPGSRRTHDDVANSIFRNDERPLADRPDASNQIKGER